MPIDGTAPANVRQAVSFFTVTDIETSLRFYVEGLGFVVTHEWRPERAGGRIESICFMCDDAVAIYRELVARGVAAKRPFVGNRLWVTSVQDPDGYHLDFESPADLPEETVYAD